ncbi:MAG: hypothetical protein Pars2KO_13500 [Parasphingorhabdus sp.]
MTEADSKIPERDYRAVLDRFDAAVAGMLFDPRIINEPRWSAFRDEFGKAALQAQTDREFLAAFVNAKEEQPLFSHFELRLQNETVDEMKINADEAAFENTVAQYERLQEDVGYIRIRSFFGEAIIDQINDSMEKAIASGVPSLIVDLRGNPGGTFAAWPVFSRLAIDPMPVGHLVASRWYVDHDTSPSTDDIEKAIPLSIPDGKALAADLMDDGLLVLSVEPQRPVFTGDVYVLIDSKSESTSEIVAGGLQFSGRAKIVGARSAGKVLNAEQISLAKGVFFLLPIADFFLPDGTRLEGRGVMPDYPVGEGDALKCAIRLASGKVEC